jgi:hypothetical protein
MYWHSAELFEAQWYAEWHEAEWHPEEWYLSGENN